MTTETLYFVTIGGGKIGLGIVSYTSIHFIPLYRRPTEILNRSAVSNGYGFGVLIFY